MSLYLRSVSGPLWCAGRTRKCWIVPNGASITYLSCCRPCCQRPPLWAPVPSPVPSLKTLRPCPLAWRQRHIGALSVFLSSGLFRTVLSRNVFTFVPGVCQPTLLSNPDANFDPFLLFSVTSVRIGGGKWEPDASVHTVIFPWIQTIMVVSEKSPWAGNYAGSTPCSVCEHTYAVCDGPYIHVFGVPQNHAYTEQFLFLMSLLNL